MKKTIIGAIALLFIVGGLFWVSAINKKTEMVQNVPTTCGEDGCNGNCNGNCGNPDCQCAKLESGACGAGACSKDCGGSCGAKTCGCNQV